MRRPLAIAGFAYFAALFAASSLTFQVNAALAVLLVVFAGAAFFAFGGMKAGKPAALALLAAAVALGVYCLTFEYRYIPAVKLAGQQATITGEITELPRQSNGKTVYLIKADRIVIGGRDTKISAKLRMSFAAPLNARPYDHVKVKALLSMPAKGAGYDSTGYYRSKGVYLFAKPVGAAEITANKHPPLMYYALALRMLIMHRVTGSISGQGGALASGILIGDTSSLSAQVSSDFTDTGISHILAVSGTQTSLIAQCLLMLFCMVKLPRRAAAPASMAGVLLFMAVTGFSPSVSRAGVMSVIYLAGLMIGREADALNSLAVSVLLLCLINPFAATDTGLLLSFAATLGMILLSGRITALASRSSERWPHPARTLFLKPVGVLSETVGASLFTVPVIMLTFKTVSLVSLLSNLLEVPLSLFATISTALVALIAPVRWLAFPFAFVTKFCCLIMIWVARALASLPFATASTAYQYVDLYLLFVACMAAVCVYYRKKGANLIAAAVCCCFALVCGVFSHMVAARGVLEIDCLSVGNGSSTVLMKDGKAAVIGLSGYRPELSVETLLKKRDIRQIALLALTDASQKTAGSANALLQSMPCGLILCPAGYQGQKNASLRVVDAPVSVSVWDDAPLTMTPDGEGGLLAVAGYQGRNMLFYDGKQTLGPNAAALKPQLVVFNSTISASIAKKLSPQYAVAGVSRSALYSCAGLTLSGAKVFRTQDGAVRLRTIGGDCLVSQEGAN